MRLHVIVLPALHGLGSGTPLFDLDGGPGVGDWHVAPLYATALRELRALGDVVLVDQRGTGYSATLACPALDDAPRTLYPEATDAVASDIPVLAVVGDRDPVTPPAWAQRATVNMRHARVLRVPWMGHLPDGLAHLDCLTELQAAFLRDPGAPLDTSCVATMTPPPFATR
ncbi:MAG TPA: alpha/beta hydrolase [Polyangiaceae bacterium]|nr:alpha/beta hydrolase [Polyangiaceae bacterium]